MIRHEYISFTYTFVLALSFLWTQVSFAAKTNVWTDDPDWEQGQEVNVNHSAVPGQLQLNKGEGGGQIYTPFIWIANSGSN
ncbi:MAG: hypothetical protein GXP49_08610, partial [Deltaproteobacteria bacterium]|nr:hypothetical protein [Deltaproteobacteria bacterium]